MQTAEIRRRFLEHFAQRGHTVVPSASLVSPDPSLLFTVAGMVPFIPYLTGREPAPYPRATSVQKCVRTAAKKKREGQAIADAAARDKAARRERRALRRGGEAA